MPHATRSNASSSVASPAARDKTAQQLTESILTLQKTIQNIKEDVAAGIAPSIIVPANADQDITSPMLLLTLDPSHADIDTHLTPLTTRLSTLETTLRSHYSWLPPSSPPKSPEYSIIDVSDLSSAITLLENILSAGVKPREWWH